MIRTTEHPLLWTGFLATLSGVGLSRFAYTALMPLMVQHGWFSAEQAAYLGAANLLGYLLGALAAHRLTERLGVLPVLAGCWAVVALSFAASCMPQGMGFFFVWRCVAGVAGAILMVVGPSAAMSAAAVDRRSTLGPLMFCGIGAGALLSATIVPSLAALGLGVTWIALALLAALTGMAGWRCARRLPAPPLHAAAPAVQGVQPAAVAVWTAPVVLVFLAYTADAFGFVPHTVFWVDYLAREQQLGAGYAATQWAVFGMGAIAGPLGAALCATRWGWWRTTVGAYALKATAIGLPLTGALGATWWGHSVSSFIVGALSPGMAAITSGYLLQLIGPAQHKRMWGLATAAFALTQAASGYTMAWLYSQQGQYRPLFGLGFAALLLGTALMAASRPRRAQR